MADVILAIVPFLSPTTIGTIDVVADGAGGRRDLGGITPKAVIIVGGAAPNSDTVEGPDTNWTYGFAVNGGNQNCSRFFCDDAVASSTTRRRWRNDRVISSDAGLEASLNAWITNGVRLNFDVVAGTARRYFAIIIGGIGVTAYTDTLITPVGTNLTSNITAPGFTPDIVFAHSCWTSAASNTNVADAAYCFGVGERVSGSNHCTSFFEASGVATASNPVLALYDNKALAKLTGTPTLDSSAVINDYDASGFSLQYTGTTTNDGNVAYLALKLDNTDIKVTDFTVEVATGNKAYTGIGFLPDFGITAGASSTTKNTPTINDANSNSLSFGAFDGFQQRTHSTRNDHAVDPSDNAELTSPNALVTGTATNVRATRATLVSFDADGFTLNYAAVSAVATNTWAVLFGPSAIPDPIDHHATQAMLETLQSEGESHSASQAFLETIHSDPPTHSASQVFVEVLRSIPHVMKHHVQTQMHHEPIPPVET